LFHLVYHCRHNDNGILYHVLRAIENVCDVKEACQAILDLKVNSKNALDILIDDILANNSSEGAVVTEALKIIGLIGSHSKYQATSVQFKM